jgi:hypothetical protein
MTTAVFDAADDHGDIQQSADRTAALKEKARQSKQQAKPSQQVASAASVAGSDWSNEYE